MRAVWGRTLSGAPAEEKDMWPRTCSILTPLGDAAACSRATFPTVAPYTASPCFFP